MSNNRQNRKKKSSETELHFSLHLRRAHTGYHIPHGLDTSYSNGYHKHTDDWTNGSAART